MSSPGLAGGVVCGPGSWASCISGCLLEPVRGEDDHQPGVDGGQQVGFAEVNVAGVADVAGQGVVAG